eukprot:6194798-Pleurochrysis_carterae.AAC.1
MAFPPLSSAAWQHKQARLKLGGHTSCLTTKPVRKASATLKERRVRPVVPSTLFGRATSKMQKSAGLGHIVKA